MKTTESPRLYVGTYAKYNRGSIAGQWLDLDDYSDRDAFLEAAAALHEDEEDPELMFQDFEGFPRTWYSESSAPPEELWSEWLDLDDNEREAFGLYIEDSGEATLDEFRDAYQGTADSEKDFAEELAEQSGHFEQIDALPDFIRYAIDWQSAWDCTLRHEYFSERGESGTLHFFARI